jgi:HK97 family phage major capsid protein
MNTQLIEAGGQLDSKRKELAAFYGQFDKKGDAQAPAMTGDDVAKFQALNAEVNDLAKSFEGLKKVWDAAEANREALEAGKGFAPTPAYGAPRQQVQEAKSLGQLAYEAKISANKGKDFDFGDVNAKQFMGLEAKTTMSTGTGYAPEVLRDGNVVPKISRPPQLIDYLRIDPTTQNSIKFMKQSTRTNNAAAANEGSTLGEAAIAYTETTDIISRIGVFLPVTEEQLEDVSELESILDADLGLMVRQELDRQATVGNGTDPELLGIYNAASIATQARGADPALDAILKGMEKITTLGRANPGLLVMHGTDLTALALTRTADGLYILGSPTDSIMTRVWGLPVVRSEALTAGNALLLDPFYFRVKLRKGVTIKVSDSHASNFVSNILVIRAHVRAGLQRLRDEAACTVTGL